MTDPATIPVGTPVDGDDRVALPIVDVLTGRGFVTGKSGSGKSNTASVVVEQLLDASYPVLIVDIEGEYYGLKEEFEMLHVGADEECDLQVNPEHAEKLAELALEQNVPIILDISGYLDEGVAAALVRDTAGQLFAREKKLKKPFLLVVEEVHEWIPERGGMDEAGRMLIKIGKRGRKHGLGIVGISQRPADVKKDFITQANWLVWHRLTWENDTKVVGRIVGGEYGEAVAELGDGEAFVQADWNDAAVSRIQFDRKRTFDAGATPGLDDVERPELKSVSDALVDDLRTITDRGRRERDRVTELEGRLAERDERIAELEAELQSARNVSKAARQLARALTRGAPEDGDADQRRLDRYAAGAAADRIGELEAEVHTLRDRLARIETPPEDADPDGEDNGDGDEPDDALAAHLDRLRRKGAAIEGADATPASAGEAVGPAPDTASDTAPDPSAIVPLLHAPAVVARIDGAQRASLCNEAHTWDALSALLSRGRLGLHDLAAVVEPSVDAVGSLLDELRARSLVTRDDDRRYALDREQLTILAADDDRRAAFGELGEQWRVD